MWGFLKVICTFSHLHLVMVGHIFTMMVGFTIIYMKREGVEFFRKTTSSNDELFYWIMSGFFYKVAFQFELENRVENRDGRRVAFNEVLDLMGIISDEWRLKAQNEIDDILAKNPYTDTLKLK